MVDDAATGLTWRIIANGAGDASWNMAVDGALFRSATTNGSVPTLRLYYWKSASLTVGRFQNVARTVHLDNCTARNIPVVRRITGGRGILHGDDLTISVTCNTEALGLESSSPLADIYQRLATVYLGAFRVLGIETSSGDRLRQSDREPVGDCFDIVSQADIVDNGSRKKLLGSAIHRHANCILQQVSIPLNTAALVDRYSDIAGSIFYGSNRADQTAPPVTLNPTALQDAVLRSISTAFGCLQRPGTLSPNEIREAERLQSTVYEDSEWTAFGRSAADAEQPK